MANKEELEKAEYLITSDGFVFQKQPDGSYSDGDMSSESFDVLFEQMEGDLSVYHKPD